MIWNKLLHVLVFQIGRVVIQVEPAYQSRDIMLPNVGLSPAPRITTL